MMWRPRNWGVVFGHASVREFDGAPDEDAFFVGEEAIDTANGGWYKAVTTGSGSNDWVLIGGGTP